MKYIYSLIISFLLVSAVSSQTLTALTLIRSVYDHDPYVAKEIVDHARDVEDSCSGVNAEIIYSCLAFLKVQEYITHADTTDNVDLKNEITILLAEHSYEYWTDWRSIKYSLQGYYTLE